LLQTSTINSTTVRRISDAFVFMIAPDILHLIPY
jgi:hypothetical protein